MWSIGFGWRTRDWQRCNAPVNSEQHRRGPRAPSSFLRPIPSSRGACDAAIQAPFVIPDLIRYPLPSVIPDLIRYPCFADGPRVFARGDIGGAGWHWKDGVTFGERGDIGGGNRSLSVIPDLIRYPFLEDDPRSSPGVTIAVMLCNMTR